MNQGQEWSRAELLHELESLLEECEREVEARQGPADGISRKPGEQSAWRSFQAEPPRSGRGQQTAQASGMSLLQALAESTSGRRRL